MKKRAKIITTVASLCLAVALMAFGVYAATQVTLGISSEVSFTVQDVFVTIDASATLTDTAAQNMTQYVSYTTNANGAKVANGFGQEITLDTWEVEDIAYTSTKRVITYVITVQNDSQEDSCYVDINLVMANVAGTFRTAQYVITDDDVAGTPVAMQTAETTYSSSATAWSFTDVANVPASTTGTSKVVITLTRTLEDVSKSIAADTASLTGSIVVTKINPSL